MKKTSKQSRILIFQGGLLLMLVWFAGAFTIAKSAQIIENKSCTCSIEETCGNNICDENESSDTCFRDCSLCGNGICEENESPYSCLKDCNDYEEVFEQEKCETPYGKNVFNHFSCGSEKIYGVKPQKSLKLSAYGDSCNDCICYHINFDLYDYVGDQWVKKRSVDGPDIRSGKYIFDYVPIGNKIKLVGASGCFHFNLYKKKTDDQDDDKNNVVISSAKSTVMAFPESVFADGSSFSTLTITIKDENDNVISGKTVVISSDRDDSGKNSVNSAYTAVTDSEGKAEVKINSSAVGVSTYTIVVEGIALTQKAKINFTSASICEKEVCETENNSNECSENCEKNENKEKAGNAGNCLSDGTLIRIPDDPKIYVIKNCKKQWIKTEKEFQQMGYKWSDVEMISTETINVYDDYLEIKAELLRALGHYRIYRIVNGKKLWIPTVSAFNAQGLKWDNVQETDQTELEKYPQARLIKVENDLKVYYVTELGLKKHIINPEVFNSYGNNWNDIVVVSSDIVNSFPDVNLIKGENDYKVYKIEGNKKVWITTVEEFKKMGYDWSSVVTVNDTELSAYATCEDVE